MGSAVFFAMAVVSGISYGWQTNLGSTANSAKHSANDFAGGHFAGRVVTNDVAAMELGESAYTAELTAELTTGFAAELTTGQIGGRLTLVANNVACDSSPAGRHYATINRSVVAYGGDYLAVPIPEMVWVNQNACQSIALNGSANRNMMKPNQAGGFALPDLSGAGDRLRQDANTIGNEARQTLDRTIDNIGNSAADALSRQSQAMIDGAGQRVTGAIDRLSTQGFGSPDFNREGAAGPSTSPFNNPVRDQSFRQNEPARPSTNPGSGMAVNPPQTLGGRTPATQPSAAQSFTPQLTQQQLAQQQQAQQQQAQQQLAQQVANERQNRLREAARNSEFDPLPSQQSGGGTRQSGLGYSGSSGGSGTAGNGSGYSDYDNGYNDPNSMIGPPNPRSLQPSRPDLFAMQNSNSQTRGGNLQDNGLFANESFGQLPGRTGNPYSVNNAANSNYGNSATQSRPMASSLTVDEKSAGATQRVNGVLRNQANQIISPARVEQFREMRLARSNSVNNGENLFDRNSPSNRSLEIGPPRMNSTADGLPYSSRSNFDGSLSDRLNSNIGSGSYADGARGDRSSGAGSNRYDDPYAGNGFEDDRYSNDRFPDKRFADDRFADDRFADDKYGDDKYGDANSNRNSPRYRSTGTSFDDQRYDRYDRDDRSGYGNDRGDDRYAAADRRHSSGRDSMGRNFDERRSDSRGGFGSFAGRPRNGIESPSDSSFSGDDLKANPIDLKDRYQQAGVVPKSISYTTTPLVNGILLVSGIINFYLFIWLRNIRVRYRELVASKRVVESAAV